MFTSTSLFARLHALWLCAVFLCLSTAPGMAQAQKKAGTTQAYTYFAVGNVAGAQGGVAPRIDLPVPRFPSYVLMGGGPDVDEGFRWMIQKAGITPSSGGRLVVVRTTGDGAYNPYIFYSNKRSSTRSSDIVDGWVGGASLGLTSVETLVIPSVAAANDPTVNAIVGNANAVWIAGGDQSTYIRFWKGTLLESTLARLMEANVPIGGTSAGLAVMGGFDYSALYASATSPLSLANPYYTDITFDPSPLSTSGGFIAPPAFRNVIFDSHLDSRDRLGRLVAFVSRLIGPFSLNNATYGCTGGVLSRESARGIGIGVETALLVEGNAAGYSGKVVTNISTTTPSAVYLVESRMGASSCALGKPLETPTSSIAVRTIAADKVNISAAQAQAIDLTGYPTVGAQNFYYTTGGSLYPAARY